MADLPGAGAAVLGAGLLQPGGGVNFVLGDGWGIFGAADWRRVFLDEETDGSSGLNQVRVFVGVRMILD